MSTDGSEGVMSDGSATSGDDYVPVKKKQKRLPSNRAAAQQRTTRKRAAYVELSDDETDLDSDLDSAQEADAGNSEDQVTKSGHIGLGAMTHCSTSDLYPGQNAFTDSQAPCLRAQDLRRTVVGLSCLPHSPLRKGLRHIWPVCKRESGASSGCTAIPADARALDALWSGLTRMQLSLPSLNPRPPMLAYGRPLGECSCNAVRADGCRHM
jgi:hypothetical protein